MEIKIFNSLLTRPIFFKNGYTKINYKRRDIKDLKRNPLTDFIDSDLSQYKDFKKFFSYYGVLYFGGFIALIEKTLLPPFESVQEIDNFIGYLDALDHGMQDSSEDEYEFYKAIIYDDYKKKNKLDFLKAIEKKLLKEYINCREENTPLEEKNFKKIFNFIFNNDFYPYSESGYENKIRFEGFLNNLKKKLKNCLKYLSHISGDFKNNKNKKEIKFSPCILDYTVDEKLVEEDYGIEEINYELNNYLDKIKIKMNVLNNEEMFKYAYSDLDFDTLLFLEFIQNLMDKIKIGTCSWCKAIILLNRRQENWHNNYCNENCRKKANIFRANENKKNRLKIDLEYRVKNNDYMRKYMKKLREETKISK